MFLSVVFANPSGATSVVTLSDLKQEFYTFMFMSDTPITPLNYIHICCISQHT